MTDVASFGRWLARTIPTLASFPLKPSKEIEWHHLTGRKHSSVMIPLPKNWHEFITKIQNTLPPKIRKESIPLALTSLSALLIFIGIQLLRVVWEVYLND